MHLQSDLKRDSWILEIIVLMVLMFDHDVKVDMWICKGLQSLELCGRTCYLAAMVPTYCCVDSGNEDRVNKMKMGNEPVSRHCR